MDRLTATARYAILAMMDLAAHGSADRPAKIREIAARTGSPAGYLVHILLKLKRSALVNSRRGPAGGYWLLRPPELVSVAQVIAAVEGRRRSRTGEAGQPTQERALARLWTDTERHRREFLAQITLADLLRGGEDA